MYVVWLSPGGRGGFTGIFPPPQAACFTVASGEKGLWVVWYDSDVVKAQGREIRIGRILICVSLRVIILLVVGINPVTLEW